MNGMSVDFQVVGETRERMERAANRIAERFFKEEQFRVAIYDSSTWGYDEYGNMVFLAQVTASSRPADEPADEKEPLFDPDDPFGEF